MHIDKFISTKTPVQGAVSGAITRASLSRLPEYHHYLVDLAARGVNRVSSSAIGLELNYNPVQVRKDLQYTGIVGKPKTGYEVGELIDCIETFLGWNNPIEALLVGAGNLGTALLGHERFSKFGMRIAAAFDTAPERIGQWIHGKEVLPLNRLAELARRMSIHLGIITVPPAAARAVAGEMVNGGILAIWNFAPVKLGVPEHIFVHNEDLYSSLASFTWDLSRRFGLPIRAHRQADCEPGGEQVHEAGRNQVSARDYVDRRLASSS